MIVSSGYVILMAKKNLGVLMKLIYLVTLIVVLISCASNTKLAKEHMEKGNWEVAHKFWVAALLEDPSNEEAVEGKREAEFQITNKKLVQLRNLIKVGKSQQAVDLTWELDKLHRQWGYTDGHNISSFHDKQIKMLYPLFISLIKTENYQKYPIKQYILVSRFEPIFTKRNLNDIKDIKASLENRGKKYCNKLRSSINRRQPFHTDMVSRVCHIFDQAAKVPRISDSENEFLNSLASSASYSINVGGLSQDYYDNLRSEMMKNAEKSPFFHMAGKKKMDFNIVGAISKSVDSRIVLKQKDYTATETYYDYETTYVDGRKEKKKVKKTRDVQRTYTYRVSEATRSFQVQMKAKYNLFGRDRFITYTDTIKETITNHNNTASYAGIYPVSEQFKSKSLVMNEILQKFSVKAKDQLNELWKRQYCDGDLPGGFSPATEKMMKCRMLAAKENKKYQAWLNTFFGITQTDDISDFERLMGLSS